MRLIITGGSGLIGRALTKRLASFGYEIVILSRNPVGIENLPGNARAVHWDGKSAEGWSDLAEGAKAIINLAGENISGEGFFPTRWTAERKRRILESRINAAKAVVEGIRAAQQRPEALVQASAIGYYGVSGDELIDENSPPGKDFLAGLCQEWEGSSAAVEELGVRRVIIRSGVVLSMEGGALPRMVLPFRFFAGGSFGSGRQYLSWIHMDDLVCAVRFLLENEKAGGVFNLTAPNPVTNAEFSKILGKLMARPSFLTIPAFAFRLFFGEVSTVVLDGQRVLPKRLQDFGYHFKYRELETALREIMAK